MKTRKADILGLVLFLTLFAQLFFGVLLFLSGLKHGADLTTKIILTVKIPLVLASFLVFNVFRLLAEEERERQRDEDEARIQLEQSCHLIDSLEAQRHDFRNQLQVIRALAAMGKTGEIQQYIGECGSILDQVAWFTRVRNSVIQALFLAFSSKMRESEVDFEVDCPADLAEFSYPAAKISRIFANLLQNALEAATAKHEAAPRISVAIREDESAYHFIFWNSGPEIPAADLDRIFNPGFSSKSGQHRGLGLTIVRGLTEELGGTLAVYSSDGEGTEFHLQFPRENRRQSPRTYHSVSMEAPD